MRASTGCRSGHMRFSPARTASGSQPRSKRPTPMGISSIKRTGTPPAAKRARPAAAPAVSSSSTAFSFTGTPSERISSSEARTASTTPPEPHIRRSRSSSAASRLMFTLSSPAAARASPYFASRVPLVVMETFLTPGTAFRARTNSTAPRRTSGSPPVTRTCSTPSAAARRATRRNSS